MKQVIISCADKANGLKKVDIKWPIDPIRSYHPQLFLVDRAEFGKISGKIASKTLEGILQQGVYILIAEMTAEKGRFNVAVGTDDFIANKKTLLECIIEQDEQPFPSKIKYWKKAIVICDWGNDIPIGKIGNVSNSTEDDKKAHAISEESAFIKQMIYETLNCGIFNIQLRKGQEAKSCIVNPAFNRYNHYLFSVFHLIEKIFPTFFKECEKAEGCAYGTALPKLMLNGKVRIGEKLYGNDNSEAEAIVFNLNGFIRLDKYNKSNLNEPNSLSKLTSMTQAIKEICNSNEKAPVGYLKFWSIKRNGEKIKFENL